MKQSLLVFFLIAMVCPGCSDSREWKLSGRTMGTTYHVTLISHSNPQSFDLAGKIRRRLDRINRSMSLFDEQSELSRFNSAPSGQPFCLSDDFRDVFLEGQALYTLTAGAWDGTMAPLVNLWGFGPESVSGAIPDETAILKARSQTGYGRIMLTADQCLVKAVDALGLDFGSIAKGFAVDRVLALLVENGVTNCLVEIGGEVRTSGTKKGRPWTVGINTPDPGASVDQVLTAISLSGRAIATSGDYRNYRITEGRRFAHVIDPSTGWPIDHAVASVSVLADSAVFADGLATALMVMGEDQGLALVNRLDRVECLFIVRTDQATFRQIASAGWPKKE